MTDMRAHYDEAVDLPTHWIDGAKDTYANVLDERPELSGADFAGLEQAAELITSADLLDEAARESGPLVYCSSGQLVTNPAIVEARQARTAAAAILARLSLPSAGAKTNAQRARTAARARWSK